MANWHIGRDNWFLVIPAAILGLVALYTVNQMYRAGDIRRSIQVVTTYEVAGQVPFGEFLEAREGGVECLAVMVSRFYGTLDVSCTGRTSRQTYQWRVHVGQGAFAPADEPTRALMREYAPEVFAPEGSL
jgi:hypothetical protein